jgi:predicted NACHT family NTPase
MSRTVRQINTPLDHPEGARPRPFSDFADCDSIVLLGDPGAGKSHLFRETAAAEGARFITARAFHATPIQQLLGRALYIDALDEHRAGRGDRSTISAMVEKLFAINPDRVRISCRAADWLGESDLAALRPYFEQRGDLPVLLLQSLSDEEQLAVLTEKGADSTAATAFIDEAVARGLTDFLQNPQNLLMFWRTVSIGAWPRTRAELFELATGLMLQESDLNHTWSKLGSYTAAELRPVAGAICAARLISDVDGISLTNQEGTKEIPSYRSLSLADPERTIATLSRRIFEVTSDVTTVDYAHRTTAEFLGASFLASRIREGLPLALLIRDGEVCSPQD